MTLIGTVRKHAIQYGKQLPDFLCVERIRRYYQQNDPKITSPGWRIIDSIAAQVTYIDGHENYRAIRLNNKPAPAAALSDLRGTVSQGEFGTMLQDIFRLESEARFAEGRPAKLRGRRALVFTYDIEQENSRYRLTVDNNLAYVPA